MAADEIRQCRRIAFVGHVNDLQPGHGVQQFAGKMRDAAAAGRSEVHLAGAGFCQSDQFLEIFCRNARVNHEAHRRGVDQRDRLEVFCGVVRKFGQHAGNDRERRRCDQQHVAVGRRFGNDVGTDHGIAAGAVIDDDLLAPDFTELGRENAGDDVGAAAGGKGHDQAYRFARIVLRLRQASCK